MLNPSLQQVVESPIGETKRWLDGRSFPAHRPLLNVSQAVPGYPPPDELIDHIKDSAAQFEAARYTPILGIPALRAALAADVSAQYGAAIGAGQVGITSGCNEAFCVASMAVAAAGTEIVLPVPYYFNHDMWLRSTGVAPVYLETGVGMLPDPADAADLINDRTRAIVLVTPNNPTGAIYPPDLIAEFRDLASRHGIALIIDETYRDFLPEGAPHHLFSHSAWTETVIHLYSFSKVFSLTGYRVGAIVAGEHVLDQVAKLLDSLTICPPAIGQMAALYGLGHLAEWRDDKRAEMQRKIERFAAAMIDTKWSVESAGAFFAYVRHPFGETAARDVARLLLDEQSVLALSGDMFGPGQESFLRLAFGNLDEPSVDVLVDRLVAAARP